jgi:hypothetical protein
MVLWHVNNITLADNTDRTVGQSRLNCRQDESAQAKLVTHAASHSMGTGWSFPGKKTAEV